MKDSGKATAGTPTNLRLLARVDTLLKHYQEASGRCRGRGEGLAKATLSDRLVSPTRLFEISAALWARIRPRRSSSNALAISRSKLKHLVPLARFEHKKSDDGYLLKL
jgi:hypothetical protein